MPLKPLITPELMAPAGNWDCARAAVENGADAVYFGLQGGFNARARAVNFAPAELPELMTFLRTRGVKGYLTLNTLAFVDELEEVERTGRLAIAAGVDAVLIQDLGVLRLMHRLCPELPLHASTQMTLSSAESIREVEQLGVRRVVLPRELSIAQIAAIRGRTNVELEVFVHGALCISYSGQCLASLAFGGRSANRGQCAQPCRLPYEVLCGGQDGTDLRYPLSPHDLAAYDRLRELVAAGVAGLKIEGRLKPADYVATVTRHYRAALDRVSGSPPDVAGKADHGLGSDEIAEMEVAFSRGFCHGWLDGDDHQALVLGLSSSKQGTYLGEVKGGRGERVRVELAAPVRRGDGLVFEGDRSDETPQGGRVYEVFQRGRSVAEVVPSGTVELAFRNGAIDPAKLYAGQKVWKTDDPQVARRLRTAEQGGPDRRVPVDLVIEAAVGSPLRVTVNAATGAACRLESPLALQEAVKHPLTADTLVEQFSRLGKTPYKLGRLQAKIDGRPMIPLSILGQLRHEMVRLLDAAAANPPQRRVIEESVTLALRAEMHDGAATCETTIAVAATAETRAGESAPCDRVCIHVLCRSMEQVEAALACGASSVIVDFRDLGRIGDAVKLARAAGTLAVLAVPRIHKPGESGVLELFAGQKPDGILVRNLASLAFFRQIGLPIVSDFSLNAVNDLTVRWLHGQGAQRVTAAYDLDNRRLLELAAVVPPEWLEVVIYRHTPMFHSEYCLFCRVLSKGTNRGDCGRPCQRHDVRLRDRLGVEHRLRADSQCRNTLFHADAENLSEIVPALRARGVRHFRVELLTESSVEDARRAIPRCE